MKIDFKNWNLRLHLETGERFVTLQDCVEKFDLCFRIRNGEYQIPYIALPLLRSACKKLGYKLNYGQGLLEAHKLITDERVQLELIKMGELTQLQNMPIFQRIWAFIESLERQGHFTLSEGQKRSVCFAIIGKKILIGNGVGTGKTLMINCVAKYILKFYKMKKVLILVPATLVKNYYDDYVKFFGNSGVMKIQSETKKKRKELYKLYNSSPNLPFLITNFEKCYFDVEELKTIRPDIVVVDEFHKMKNFLGAKRSINFFHLLDEVWKPTFRFPMSGTPIENKLFDLFPIFKLLDGGVILGGQNFFSNNFVVYQTIYRKIRDKSGQFRTIVEEKATGFKNLEFMKKLVKPRIIREKLDLPVGKYHEYIVIEPTKKLIDKYNIVKLEAESASKRYHSARQFLCDTSRGDLDDNPKFEYIDDILEQSDEKLVIFSFYLCSIEAIKQHLIGKKIGYLAISGQTKAGINEIVAEFNSDDSKRVLICTDRAATGINGMTCARWMVEWDIPMKPSQTEQRIGRIYRTGQQRDVHVRSLVVAGTVEEIIHTNYQEKAHLIQKAIEELDHETLETLEIEIQRKVLDEFKDPIKRHK